MPWCLAFFWSFVFLPLSLFAADQLRLGGQPYPLERRGGDQGVTFMVPGEVWAQVSRDDNLLVLGPLALPACTLTQMGPTGKKVIPLPEVIHEKAYFVVPLLPQVQSLKISLPATELAECTFEVSSQVPRGQTSAFLVDDGATTYFFPQGLAPSRGLFSCNFAWLPGNPVSVKVKKPGTDLNFTVGKYASVWNFFPELWDFFPESITFQGKDFRLTKAAGTVTSPQAPLFADPTTIIRVPPLRWRNPEREFFQWSNFPGIVVLMTKSYEVQDRYLKRLAFFVEKPGFRTQLASDEEIASRHGWNAHDYGPADLAAFFTLAQNTGFALHPEERELRDKLTAWGVLTQEDGGWRPGGGALLGLSMESDLGLRELFFTHEAFHGLYFISQDFRDETLRIWNRLSPQARAVFVAYLGKMTYDPHSRALMVNEFQAYCLQQRKKEAKEFLSTKVIPKSAVQLSPGEGEAVAAELESAVDALDQSVFKLFKVRAGLVFSVTKGP